MQIVDRITWDPHQMNGQPCIRGMRQTVRRVLEAVALYPANQGVPRDTATRLRGLDSMRSPAIRS